MEKKILDKFGELIVNGDIVLAFNKRTDKWLLYKYYGNVGHFGEINIEYCEKINRDRVLTRGIIDINSHSFNRLDYLFVRLFETKKDQDAFMINKISFTENFKSFTHA